MADTRVTFPEEPSDDAEEPLGCRSVLTGVFASVGGLLLFCSMFPLYAGLMMLFRGQRDPAVLESFWMIPAYPAAGLCWIVTALYCHKGNWWSAIMFAAAGCTFFCLFLPDK
jgi:apolipoprotein N-acyltransferase